MGDRLKKKIYLYSSVTLIKEDQEYLKQYLTRYLDFFYFKRTGILNKDDYDVKCHHMTITLGKLEDSGHIKYMEDETIIPLVAYKIGYSDKAIALKVSCPINSKNEIPHITLCSINKNGGKPKDSNSIEIWESIEPILLSGKIKEYCKYV